MRSDAPDSQGTAALLLDTVAQAARIFGLEARLARQEMAENLKGAAMSLALLAAGAVLALVALIALAGAGVAGLVALGMPAAWAALSVGALFAVLAAVLIAAGIRGIGSDRLMPRRTLDNLRRDAAILRERVDGQA